MRRFVLSGLLTVAIGVLLIMVVKEKEQEALASITIYTVRGAVAWVQTLRDDSQIIN